MKFLAVKAAIIFSILAMSTTVYAQTNQSKLQTSSPKPVSRELASLAATLSDAQNDVISAALDYKEKLQIQLTFEEENVKRVAIEVGKRKELLALQIIAKRELEEKEQELAQARDKVEETKSKMESTDNLIAEVTAEDPMETARRLLARRKQRERTPRGRVYYITFVIVGKITIYDYSGAINGQLIKYQDQIKHDSRRSR